MIEWLHTATRLQAYHPDKRRRGMIVKKVSGSGVVYEVFVDRGAYVGSCRTFGYAKEFCKEELER